MRRENKKKTRKEKDTKQRKQVKQTKKQTKRKRLSMAEKALLALREAVREAIEEHKRYGIPLIVWRDGQVKEIPPEELDDL